MLDLGSGAGFDCFLARAMAGKDGFVIGVDMAPAMIRLSQKQFEKKRLYEHGIPSGGDRTPARRGQYDGRCAFKLRCQPVRRQKAGFCRGVSCAQAPGGASASVIFLLLSPLPQRLFLELSAYFLCIEGAHVGRNRCGLCCFYRDLQTLRCTKRKAVCEAASRARTSKAISRRFAWRP